MAYPPRLGKTFAEITAMQRRTDVTRTLIVGPKNALALTWADELEKAWIRQVPLVSGTIRERAERLTQLLADNISHPVAVTINYDILDAWIEPIMHLGAGWNFRGTIYPTKHEAEVARALAKSPRIIDLLMRWNPQALICDEAHYLSSAGSHRSQALRKLARGVKYRRLLSGTPDPKRGPSFYSQYVILDPTIFGTSKARFLDRYFHMDPVIRGRVIGMKSDMANEFYTKVYSIMQVVRREDYFGPDNPNEITRELDWPEKAGKIYRTLQKDSVVNDEELTIDGTHRLTKLLRGLQLCSGFIEDSATGVVQTMHEEKTNAILADLSEPLGCDSRVVISYLFTPQGERLLRAVVAAFGEGSAALVNGKTDDRVAHGILRSFDVNAKDDSKLRVLIIQEQSGAEGISLARAEYLFFASWSMNSTTHEQMRSRIWRPDRAANITYYEMKKSADGYARKIVNDKLDASVMNRVKLSVALRGGE